MEEKEKQANTCMGQDLVHFPIQLFYLHELVFLGTLKADLNHRFQGGVGESQACKFASVTSQALFSLMYPEYYLAN